MVSSRGASQFRLAALVRIVLVGSVVASCGGGGGNEPTPPPPPPPPAPAPVNTVTVAPGSAVLVPLQTTQLTAVVRDASGNTLSGRSISWTSSAPTTATVDGSGGVTGLNPGSATISAASEGRTGSAAIQVNEGLFVGPQGGTFSASAGNVTVQIPGQAVVTPTAFTVTTVQNPQPHPRLVAGTAFDFGPSGSTFAQPVTLRIKYDAAALSAGSVASQLRLHKLDGVTWNEIPGSTIDILTRTVSGQTSSFSVYAVIETILPVATVSVTPGTAALVVGASRQLAAVLRAENGTILSGRQIDWTSSNPAVASVSTGGEVTAVSLGNVTITATSEGKSGSAAIAVQAFLVTDVSPDTLSDGATITVSGQGFAPDPAANQVNVGGGSATVLAASATQLTIRVPAFNCHPTLVTFVRVTSGGVTAPDVAKPFRANGTNVLLSPGQHQVMGATPKACLHFPASTAAGSYLVGVTDIGTSSSTVPRVVDLETRGGAASSPTSASPVTLVSPRLANSRAQVRLPRPRPYSLSLRDRHRENELRYRELEAQETRGLRAAITGDRPASVMGRTSAAVVPNSGDIVQYRFPTGTSSCSFYSTITAVVRAVGQRYIVVEDISNPVPLNSIDIPRWGALLDDPIIPLVQQWFGSPTDFDANNRIVILVTRQVNQQRPGTIGFVRTVDIKYSRFTCPSSNDGEIFYLWAIDPNGQAGTEPVSSNTFVANLLNTWAHEIVHIVQFSELFRLDGDDFLIPIHWISEGGATLSEEIVGWAIQGLAANQDLGATIALTSGLEGTEWFRFQWADLQRYFGLETSTSRVSDAPESCIWTVNPPGLFSSCLGRGLHYGVGANLQRWVLDHLTFPGGPTSFTRGLYRPLSAQSGNGLTTLASVTGMSLEELIPTWQMSLWADNRGTGTNPSVQQPSWNLPDIFGAMSPFGRLTPRSITWGSDTETTALIATGSAHYSLFSGGVQASTSFRVEGSGGTTLPSTVRIWILRTQ